MLLPSVQLQELMKKRIAVVQGGFSGEAVISVKSAATVVKHLDRERFDVVLYEITESGWYAYDGETKVAVRRDDFAAQLNAGWFIPEAVVVMIHGDPGENGILQGYFELINLPYTTGDVLNLALTFNKGLTTMALRNMGLPVAKGRLLNADVDWTPEQLVAELGLPCFVKPNQGGSSLGMTKVKSVDQLPAAIEKAFAHDDQVLVESFLSGREVSIGVIPWKGDIRALPCTEIITENEFFDFAAKYEGQSQEITPADIPETQMRAVQALAERIYRSLNCGGMIRMEMMLIDGVPHVIEVNTVPGFSAASILPQQAAAAGISIQELLTELIEDALRSR